VFSSPAPLAGDTAASAEAPAKWGIDPAEDVVNLPVNQSGVSMNNLLKVGFGGYREHQQLAAAASSETASA
jgi:hypothetical protein